MEFFEAPAFTRNFTLYFDDDSYRRLQSFLLTNPEAGRIVPNTGGFRKVQWQDPSRGKGKRSGLRIIYDYFLDAAQIWLATVYDKDLADDLTPAEKKALHNAITAEKTMRAATKRRQT